VAAAGVVEMLAGERLNTGGDATEHGHDARVISVTEPTKL
jgi:hypothetical protein